CSTAYGSKSVNPVGTTTKYGTIHETKSCVQTVTPTSTISPKPVTVAAVSTLYTTATTTLPNTKVNTYTLISIIITTSTAFNTVTATASATSTVVVTTTPTDTVTIPTSSGFVYASAAPNLKKRAMAIAKRADLLSGNRPGPRIPALEKRTDQGYPNSVTCGVIVDIVTSTTKTFTASRTATITAKPSTFTQTNTITSTITSTSCPGGASTTVTKTISLVATAKVQTTTTTTTTGTITVTVAAPGPTFYAACSAQNMVNNPVGIGALDTGTQLDFVAWQNMDIDGITSAY
ncbi:MAG: hypothetical protein Q9218_007735, partial [Villophora microphyllina]